MIDILAIKARFAALSPLLNERARRLFVASEARAVGRGGLTAVSNATGVARSTSTADWRNYAAQSLSTRLAYAGREADANQRSRLNLDFWRRSPRLCNRRSVVSPKRRCCG
jgi:hypothetical protein